MTNVIFDFDGTLVDSLPAVVKVFEELVGRKKRFTPEEIEKLRHLTLAQLAYELKIPRWKAPILLFRGRRMLRRHLRSIRLHEDIATIIKQLNEQHRLYIVSSNSRQNIVKYLQWHELEDYFVEVYGGASMLGKAPKLNKLVHNEHLDPKETWYIGDEVRDVAAAKEVGVHAAAVTWGYNTQDALEGTSPEKIFATTKQLAENFGV